MERRNGFIRAIEAGGPEYKPKPRKLRKDRVRFKNSFRGNGLHSKSKHEK